MSSGRVQGRRRRWWQASHRDVSIGAPTRADLRGRAAVEGRTHAAYTPRTWRDRLRIRRSQEGSHPRIEQ